ncbi:MAG: GspMb/PilO family protein [Azospirillaceae bacterium]|nr:GspMb/PilO family protein [Azospirillaceae bacterium]
MASTTLRPGFVLLVAGCLLAVPPYFFLAPLAEGVQDAAARRVARLSQLDEARTLLAQRDDLARRAGVLDRGLVVRTLLRHGTDLPAVQADAEAEVRRAVQQAGATVRTLSTQVRPGRGAYRRLTLTLAADGDAVAVTNAVAALDAVMPRLLVRSLHIHATPPATVTVPTGPAFGRVAPQARPAVESEPVTLEMEIDIYADLAGSRAAS